MSQAPRPRILVVDDDPTTRVLMRAALTKGGYDVEVAAGGLEGLSMFEAAPFDMVMLDVDMPDLNGLEVCTRLRARVDEHLPIVMVTGMDDVHSVARAYESGATDFIAKPLNWALIGHRVRYLLRASHALGELRAANARNRAILDAIPDTLVRVDPQGVVLDVRDRALALAAASVPTAGQPLAQGLAAPVADKIALRVRSAFESGTVQHTDFSLFDPTGTRRYFETRVARIDDDEALCLLRDITARKQTEAELVLSQDRLKQAQAVARLGSWYANVATGTVEWSAQTYRMFDVPEGTPVSHEFFFERVHRDDLAAIRAAWDGAVAGTPYSVEYRIRTGAGIVWLLEKVDLETDEAGRVRGVVGTVQDITERKETENRIARLAYLDSLTGLPNRESFLGRLDRELRRARMGNRRLAILFMDLDGFKGINDTLGHDAGDQILVAAADRLRSVIRPGDIVARGEDGMPESPLARLGGDEFTAVLADLRNPEDALTAARRVGEQMRRPFLVDDRELNLTASIGIAVFPEDGEDVATLLKHADTAMYHAKELGRDNCQFYSASLTQRAMERMDMERDLRAAIAEQQFRLAFQPQYDVAAGCITSLEALIRWRHPVRGQVSPMSFIPAAEANGLIVPIGQWVLRSACEAAARWRVAGRPMRVAVNLSPLQLKSPDLVAWVMRTLAATGLPSELLELEVTEGALMDDQAVALAALHALRAAGVHIALDDFGTGYSSMSYLKRLPITTLKVDQSFVRGLPADKENDSIVRAIVSMARSLGFRSTAEGVETAEQARLLTELGCDVLQGYHFGKPVYEDDLGTLLPGWPQARTQAPTHAQTRALSA